MTNDVAVSRGVLAAALFWALLYTAFLAFSTARIRHANSDDVIFDAGSASGTLWRDSAVWARDQGRFYIPVACSVPIAFFRISNAIALASARALLVLADAGVVGFFFGRLFKSAPLGLLVGTLCLLLLQIPLGFYGVLSSPQIGVGFILTFFTMERLMADRGRSPSSGVVVVAALGAGCMNESFVAPILLASATVLIGGRGHRRAAVAAAGALLGYVFVYVLFRYRWPSHYEGAQFVLEPWDTVRAVALNVVATFPGVELLLNRHGFQGGPLIKAPSDIRNAFAGLTWGAVCLLVSGVPLALALARECAGSLRSACDATLCLALFVIGVSFLVPCCLTLTYQQWSYQRQFPYFYAMGTWFVLLGLGAVSARAAFRWLAGRGSRWRTAAWGVLAASLAVSAICVWASNSQVIRILERSPYPISDSVYRDAVGR